MQGRGWMIRMRISLLETGGPSSACLRIWKPLNRCFQTTTLRRSMERRASLPTWKAFKSTCRYITVPRSRRDFSHLYNLNLNSSLNRLCFCKATFPATTSDARWRPATCGCPKWQLGDAMLAATERSVAHGHIGEITECWIWWGDLQFKYKQTVQFLVWQCVYMYLQKETAVGYPAKVKRDDVTFGVEKCC